MFKWKWPWVKVKEELEKSILKRLDKLGGRLTVVEMKLLALEPNIMSIKKDMIFDPIHDKVEEAEGRVKAIDTLVTIAYTTQGEDIAELKEEVKALKEELGTFKDSRGGNHL